MVKLIQDIAVIIVVQNSGMQERNKMNSDLEKLMKDQGIIESEGVGFENIRDFSKFKCYYCLETFDDYDVMFDHEKNKHRSGDYSAQMDGLYRK